MKVLKWSVRLLGVTLWFGLLSNWSWTSRTMDVLHVLAAFVTGAILLRRHPHFARWSSKACVAGGILAMIWPVSVFIPPFTLAGIFLSMELRSDRVIEQVDCPGTAERAVVRYRDPGLRTHGNGQILVSVRNRWLPFVEQEVLGPVATYRTETERPFVCWVGRHRLAIADFEDTLPVRWARVDPPFFILPLCLGAELLKTWLATKINLPRGDEPVSFPCAKWQAWGVRPGLTIASVQGMDPEVRYQSWGSAIDAWNPFKEAVHHTWKVELWDRRRADRRDVPFQWREGYAGWAVTRSAFRSSRIVAVGLSAGAVPIGVDGTVVEPPVIQRARHAWGPPTRSMVVQGKHPLAESWSPPAQHADLWVDQACHCLARMTWGDDANPTYGRRRFWQSGAPTPISSCSRIIGASLAWQQPEGD